MRMTFHFYLRLLFLTFLFGFLIASCKSDKKKVSIDDLLNEEELSINFTINSQQIPGMDRIGKDISEQEYQDDPMNDEYVLHIPINGDSIYLKDISNLPEDIAEQRQWYINADRIEGTGKEIAFFSDIPSNLLITLKFGETSEYTVQKGILLVEDMEGLDAFFDNSEGDGSDIAALEDEMEEDQESSTAMVNEPISMPKKSKSPTTPKKQQVKKDIPAPQVQNISFSADKTTVTVGEGVLFRDQSSPASAVNVRVWDFGDGNNMTTRGSATSHAYYQAGQYYVKLCLNYSSKCIGKYIQVLPGQTVVSSSSTTTSNSTPSTSNTVKKASVSKVYFSMPSKAKVGKPVQIEDTSIPKSAVTSRKWYVNGKDQNLNRSKFSKTFDKAGKYEIRLCVNGSNSKDCHASIIQIENEKSIVIEDDDFVCLSTIKSGIRSSQLCSSSDKKYTDKNTRITLKPSTNIELRNATAFGTDVGIVSIKLSAQDGSFNKTIHNVQILPGRSIVEFGSFYTVLKKGKSYSLEIIMPEDGKLQLEDAASCNNSFKNSEAMAIDYGSSGMTLMDIKFCY